VTVNETYLSLGFSANPVAQGVADNLTVQAKNAGGALVPYQGRVQLSASFGSISAWGGGADASGFSTSRPPTAAATSSRRPRAWPATRPSAPRISRPSGATPAPR